MPGWAEVWARRELGPLDGAASLLARLMAADGLDTGFGSVQEPAWRAFVQSCCATIGLQPGERVFELGCGAGAFLYPIAERGCPVGGLDASPALIAIARQAMPRGEWQTADAAADLPPTDVAAACGVFMYFASPEYARQVIAHMVGSARRAVMILDVPDLALRKQDLAMRRGTLGEAAYERRYRGLKHQYYDRAWLRQELLAAGARRVEISSQSIAGYANARHRFNAFAWQ